MSIVHTGRFIKNKRGKENEKKNKNHHTIDFTSCGIAVPAVLRRQRTGNTAIRQCAIHCRAIGRRTLFFEKQGQRTVCFGRYGKYTKHQAAALHRRK